MLTQGPPHELTHRYQRRHLDEEITDGSERVEYDDVAIRQPPFLDARPR